MALPRTIRSSGRPGTRRRPPDAHLMHGIHQAGRLAVGNSLVSDGALIWRNEGHWWDDYPETAFAYLEDSTWLTTDLKTGSTAKLGKVEDPGLAAKIASREKLLLAELTEDLRSFGNPSNKRRLEYLISTLEQIKTKEGDPCPK